MGIVERLREEALALQQTAWSRMDGGQQCSLNASLAEEAADEIERLQRERNYAVRWANKSVDAVKEHDDAIICRMQAALEKCQKALAAMIDPSCIAQSTVLNAFAMATEAEAAARAALEADQCVVEIDLHAEAFKSILEAAEQSKWMPPEYMMNDWLSDVCDFLINGPSTPPTAAVTGLDGKWQLVPKEPTEVMKVLGCEYADPLGRLISWDPSKGDCTTRDEVAGVYKAMLSAAPSPVTVGGDEAEGRP